MAEMIEWTKILKKKEPSLPKEVPSPINYDIYLKANFPMAVGENKVDYKNVWDRHYRVNYWYIEGNGLGKAKITRSLFVTLLIDKDSQITHKVHKG